MNQQRNVTAIIPAYNETATLQQVVVEVSRYVNRVVIVDDGSEEAIEIDADKQRGVILRHLINLGQGAALQTGFDFAKQSGADIVVTFDADGQFSPAEIPSVVQPVIEGKADVVLGSRFLGKTVDMPLSKFILLKVAILFTLLFSGIKLTDAHNGFRAFNRKALARIEITQDRMAHASEIIDEIVKHDLRFKEVPVTVRYDDYSLGKGQDYRHSLAIVKDLLSHRFMQ